MALIIWNGVINNSNAFRTLREPCNFFYSRVFNLEVESNYHTQKKCKWARKGVSIWQGVYLISNHHRRYSVKVCVRCRYPSWLVHMSLSPDLRQTLGHGNDLETHFFLCRVPNVTWNLKVLILHMKIQSTLGFATSLRHRGLGRKPQWKSLNQVDFRLV